MLVDFSISNYKSIKEEQTLSMLSASIKEHPNNSFKIPREKLKLLKIAVIYGANGSGKSNLIEGLRDMTQFIHNSTDAKLGESISYYQPFKLDRDCLNRPMHCDIEFIGIDQIRYLYKFSFDASEILSEALYFYPKKQEAKLFVREKGKRIDFGESLKGAKKSIENQLIPNHLFLSKAANSNHKQLGKVYESIGRFLIIDTAQPQRLMRQTVEHTLTWKDNELQDKMNTLLNYADTGVEKVELKQVQSDAYHPSLSYLPFTTHPIFEKGKEVGKAIFNITEESKGTQQMYGLGGVLFAALSKGNTICIDELDISFHPLMTEYLIKLFYNEETNPKNAQLIFTTHDTSILKHELFRRDQIWFAEKDYYGATNIYSLSEFHFDKVRANIPFDKWYLSGRFGALPLFKEFEAEPVAGEKSEDS
ncbi:MAG: AAA family ATPase [Flammeovirgaceae bacterium]